MSAEQRARLAAKRAAKTDPVQREAYAIAERAGFDWFDTESSARRMAEHAAAEIVELRDALSAARKALDNFNLLEHLQNRAEIKKAVSQADKVLARLKP